MKVLIKTVVIFVLLFLFVHCNSGKTKEPFNFKIGNKIKSIDVSDKDVSLTYALQYAGSNNVYFTNSDFNQVLIIYKLNLLNFKFEKLLEVESDFYFEAYFVDEKKSLIYLFSGEYLRVYNFENVLLNKKVFGITESGYLSNQNPIGFYPYIDDDRMFIEYFPDIAHTYKSKLFYDQPLQAIYNMKKNEIELMKVSYPHDYKNKCFGYNFIPDRIINNQKQHVFTFPYNDSVYIVDSFGQLEKTFYFGTHTRNDFPYIPFDKIDSVHREVFDEFYKDVPHYGFSSFLSFSNIYTRQLIKYNQKENRSSGTIIFYNSKFEFIGQHDCNGTLSLFDNVNHQIFKIEKNNKKLNLYEVKLQ